MNTFEIFQNFVSFSKITFSKKIYGGNFEKYYKSLQKR